MEVTTPRTTVIGRVLAPDGLTPVANVGVRSVSPATEDPVNDACEMPNAGIPCDARTISDGSFALNNVPAQIPTNVVASVLINGDPFFGVSETFVRQDAGLINLAPIILQPVPQPPQAQFFWPPFGNPLFQFDDDFDCVTIEFPFPYFGTTYIDVCINSNGNLTFLFGDTDFSENLGEFLADPPRIAPIWDDLNPGHGRSPLLGVHDCRCQRLVLRGRCPLAWRHPRGSVGRLL